MRDDAFERLYSAHAEGLLGFLLYRVGERALAEDLMAETFEKALRARRRFDRRRGREKTWLYAIALNCLRDHARRAAAERRALERVGVPGDAGGGGLEAVDARQAVAAALERLSDEERTAIALRYGAELTVREIAAVTGESETTANGRVYRALEKLRRELA